MAKAKSKVSILAADGADGAPLQDWRFELGDWPIRFDVPEQQADIWLQYLSAECQKRGWNFSGTAHSEAKENSGSVTVNNGVTGQQLGVFWERKPGGPLKVRARSINASPFPLDQANELFRDVNEHSRNGITEQFYHGWQLCYEGLPWCGELWLDEMLRLGPPSQQDETASIGSRIILVSTMVKAIDWLHAISSFDLFLRELAVFLTVVMGQNVRVANNGRRGWTWKRDSSGKEVECEVRNLGYREKQPPTEMPVRGQIKSVPYLAVSRPDYSRQGAHGAVTELHLPDDILDLWRAFTALSSEKRRQFLQVGSMWQLALSFGEEYQTAQFAYMVAACEALKPQSRRFSNHKIYHVIEALLGKPKADLLQENWFRPQDTRNAHFHRGEHRGSELVHRFIMSSFEDPTFNQACRVLSEITRAAIIEWLRRNGVFKMPTLKRRKS